MILVGRKESTQSPTRSAIRDSLIRGLLPRDRFREHIGDTAVDVLDEHLAEIVDDRRSENDDTSCDDMVMRYTTVYKLANMSHQTDKYKERERTYVSCSSRRS
jgi:hypothetical protein